MLQTRRQGDKETRRQGDRTMSKIQSHRDLDVYRKAFDVAMQVFELSKKFPREETYSLTDQIRRSSRSVCANLAEAWRKRRYENAFICKLSDSESEAAETEVWVEFAVECEYMSHESGLALHEAYEEVLRMLVSMITHRESWLIKES
jgi:four helix bundle protein